jgi:hypothetical protein
MFCGSLFDFELDEGKSKGWGKQYWFSFHSSNIGFIFLHMSDCCLHVCCSCVGVLLMNDISGFGYGWSWSGWSVEKHHDSQGSPNSDSDSSNSNSNSSPNPLHAHGEDRDRHTHPHTVSAIAATDNDGNSESGAAAGIPVASLSAAPADHCQQALPQSQQHQRTGAQLQQVAVDIPVPQKSTKTNAVERRAHTHDV